MNVKHISGIDPYTVRHLDAWLEREVHENERDAIRAYMLQTVAEDEEYWSAQGWFRVYDHARRDCYATQRRINGSAPYPR